MESVWFLFWCCLWEPLLSSDCFHKLCFSGALTENGLGVEIRGIGWPGVIGSTRDESLPWGVLPEEFKSSVQAMRWHPMSISMLLFLRNAGTNFLCLYLNVLLCVDGHAIPIIIFKKVGPKNPPLPIAHHTVSFSQLNRLWVCLWGCWDVQNLMFYLLTGPLKLKWAASLNRIKPRLPGLFSILSLIVWRNSLLSSLLASVCFWRIRALFKKNFKSLWMILCTVVLEMSTSWNGDCSRCFLSSWTLARILTATYCPLWLFLSFSTLPVFLNFSTIFVIVFLHGVLLPGNSLRNSLYLRPLILLKSNFPKFLIFRALNIGLQYPSWSQTTSRGLVCSIPENKESVIIFFENISKEK